MNVRSRDPLPEYECPPVIEVVCGMQFAPLAQFQATGLGLFWQRIREEYPGCHPQPPLAHVIERFDSASMENAQIELAEIPPLPRMLFTDTSGCWLVQLQSDRFLHNWRKDHEAEAYPRFPAVFERFWRSWSHFLDFCGNERLEAPQVDQLELTYINHIVQGEGWDGPSAISKVLPDLGWRATRPFLPPPESMMWNVSFRLPGTVGRLHVSARQAIRRKDNKSVLLCELTARGIPGHLDDDTIKDWFHVGREWIVRAFADLADHELQSRIWKRKLE